MKKSLFTALLAGSLVLPTLTACGSKDSGSASSAPSATASSEAPAQEITVSVGTTFATLDPALMSTVQMSNVYSNAAANLFISLADGTQEKRLCEDYTISDDGLVYTFKIKEGVLWSDGVELTAADFVYGMKRSIGYGPANAYAVRNLTGFVVGAQEAADNQMDVADMTEVGIKELDKYSFEIDLKEPCPYFIKMFTGGVSTPVRADFAPEHDSAWSVAGPYPSLGAFKMESINPEEGAVYVKNENYYDADKVTLEKINYVVMTDSTAQLNAFKAGQLDIALNVPSDVAANSAYSNYFFQAEKYTSSYFVCINSGPKCTVEALKNANVRKALGMAIDKDTMITVLNSGDYITKLDGFIPYGFEGLNGDFRSEASYLQFNLDEAKKLMEAEGYSDSNRLKFEYLYSNSQFHADVAQMLQQFWSQIYVDVELKSVEGGVFYDFVDNGEFSTSRYANNDSSDPLNYFNIFRSSSQIEGCQSVYDEKYDTLVEEAYVETDPTEYIKKLHEIEDYMIGEQAYLLPLFTQKPVVLVQENIEGFWENAGGTTYYSDIVVK